MEDLTKHQLILLVLLVSFVTSIATGIMTVSLLQQAPLEVTRNINRVVERTFEKVVPQGLANIGSPSKEVTTVVVKEDDLIVSAIDKNVKSIARIMEKDGPSGTVSLFGIGLVVSKDGSIAADRKATTVANKYVAVMNDGTEIALLPTGLEKKTNFMLFRPTDAKLKYDFVPAALAAADLQLGQTVVSLGGDASNAVSVGRVISLAMKESGTGTSTIKYVASIETDVSSKDMVDGSPLFNLSGDIVGVKLSDSGSKIFVPDSVLKKELPALNDPTPAAL
jgi:S1-C subfamily serine protease